MKNALLVALTLTLIFATPQGGSARTKMKPDLTLSLDMLLAVQIDETAEALKLIAQGADPNVRDDEEDPDISSMTPLLWAASNGNAEIAQALLKRGANIEARDSVGYNALMQLLQQAYSSLHSHQVLHDRYKDTLNVLLQHRVDVGAPDSFGTTAVMQVAKTGDVSTMRLLLSHGARVSAANKRGETALMIAAEKGHENIVTTLLDAGADVHAKDKAGKRALDWLAGPITTTAWAVPGYDFNSSRIDARHEVEVKKIVEGRKKVKELLLAAMTKQPSNKPSK